MAAHDGTGYGVAQHRKTAVRYFCVAVSNIMKLHLFNSGPVLLAEEIIFARQLYQVIDVFFDFVQRGVEKAFSFWPCSLNGEAYAFYTFPTFGAYNRVA